MKVDIGIEEDARKEIAEGLTALLADTSTLYLKTHAYHWNVVGPMFHSLHLMFEEQYVDLRDAMDVIAEPIRASARSRRAPTRSSPGSHPSRTRRACRGPRRWSGGWPTRTSCSCARRARSSSKRSRPAMSRPRTW